MKHSIFQSAGQFAAAACILCVCALPAAAQEYPSREIRAICSFAAGSGGDILVRYYSDRIAKLAGKPVIVENRVGAQGVIGTEAAARAKPDGYTILIAPASSTLAAAPHLFKKLPYDPIRDFAPIAPITSLNFVFAVDGKSAVKTVRDLVAALKSKPDQGSFGINNNTGQVAGELFKEMASLKSERIPYTTTVQGVTDLMGGRIDFLVGDATFMTGQARAGRIRVIAVTDSKRSTALPDVPTMAESGFPGYDISAWWGGNPEAHRRAAGRLGRANQRHRGNPCVPAQRGDRRAQRHPRTDAHDAQRGQRALGALREGGQDRAAIACGPSPGRRATQGRL